MSVLPFGWEGVFLSSKTAFCKLLFLSPSCNPKLLEENACGTNYEWSILPCSFLIVIIDRNAICFNNLKWSWFFRFSSHYNFQLVISGAFPQHMTTMHTLNDLSLGDHFSFKNKCSFLMMFFQVKWPRGLVCRSQCFRAACCLHLQSTSPEAPKMETAHFTKTLASTNSFMQWLNTKEHNQNYHHHENLNLTNILVSSAKHLQHFLSTLPWPSEWTSPPHYWYWL
jgi:hypothetical protein